jgi:hypothetical protein
MIYWTGLSLMIAGAFMVVFCVSLLAWHQQRRLACMPTQIGHLSSVIGSSVTGGLEVTRIGPEYYDSCL